MTELLTDVMGTFRGATFDDVIVVIGFETGIAVTVAVGGGAGFVNGGFAICFDDGFSFVSVTVGFVALKLLILDVGATTGKVDGGEDFVGDSKVTQGSRFSNFEFAICSDKKETGDFSVSSSRFFGGDCVFGVLSAFSSFLNQSNASVSSLLKALGSRTFDGSWETSVIVT